jgi:hypothetical protein
MSSLTLLLLSLLDNGEQNAVRVHHSVPHPDAVHEHTRRRGGRSLCLTAPEA